MREDQKGLSDAKKANFKRALDVLFHNGQYKRLVDLHHDPANPHRNHSPGVGDPGLYRFLPWHRCFLLDFETELNRALAALGLPLMGVPYWRLTDPFPTWLEAFTSPFDPNYPNPVRDLSDAALKPSTVDVTNIVDQSYYLLPFYSPYVCFAFALEGRSGPINDTPLIRGHAQIHEWVGGTMATVPSSPADPVFWLLHAEVDRLWHIWQGKNPAEPGPPFAIGDDFMDPFYPPNTYAALTDITTLGYSYESLAY